MKDDLFEQIDKEKEELPRFRNRIKEVEKYTFNFYQQFAIFMMVVCFFIGIIIGNVFPSCQSSGLYSRQCDVTEFNISLTIITWFISFIISMGIFWLGHVIHLLSEIKDQLKK